MKKETIKFKNWTVIVSLKFEGCRKVPLSFDVYYGTSKVNGVLTQSQINKIEEGIHEYYNTPLFNQ